MLENKLKDKAKEITDMDYGSSNIKDALLINEKKLKRKCNFQRNPNEYLINDSDNEEEKCA